MDPLIINAALTGMVPTKSDNLSVPMTPTEIAEDAERCVRAGASIVHLHARDDDGQPTYRSDVYAEIVDGVRERCPDVIVCVSTSGRVFKTLEERSEVLALDGDVKPEMASLTLGSLNFPAQASVNDPAMIAGLAERMAERGIVPELEIFDLGMVDYARYLIERGVLRPPFYFNLLLGSRGTLSASAFNLGVLVEALPGGLCLGRCGNRALPALGQRDGDRCRWARPGRTRGQPLARRRQAAGRDERRARRTPRHARRRL